MADITFLPSEPAVVELHGGRVRPSVLVDVSAMPSIKSRRELNERLLDGTCGFSGPTHWQFGHEDLELLLLITHERFGGESALLRRQAVLALGRIGSDEAIRRLTDLAVDPSEHDGIRVAALGALGDRRDELIDQLCNDLSPLVGDYALRLRGDCKPERRCRPGQAPQDRTDCEEGDHVCRKGC